MKGELNMSNLSKIVGLEQEILVGLDINNTAITIEVDTICNHNTEENRYFSLCGTTYDLSDIFTEEEGECRASDYIRDDTEMWKMAVEADDTTASFDDWCDSVLNIDGWQHVLGDVYEIGDYDNKVYYTTGGGGGQIDVPDEFSILEIGKEELNIIKKAWKDLHLKRFVEMNDEEIKLVNRVVEIFNNYDKFDESDLGVYIPTVLGEEDDE